MRPINAWRRPDSPPIGHWHIGQLSRVRSGWAISAVRAASAMRQGAGKRRGACGNRAGGMRNRPQIETIAGRAGLSGRGLRVLRI